MQNVNFKSNIQISIAINIKKTWLNKIEIVFTCALVKKYKDSFFIVTGVTFALRSNRGEERFSDL